MSAIPEIYGKVLNIGIDVDGVLRDIMTPIINHYNKTYQQKIKIHDITNWNFDQFFPHMPDVYKYAFYENARSTFVDSQPYDGAVNFMKKIHQKYQVWIITHQYKGNEILTLEWLNKHDIPFHSIAFTPSKSDVGCHVLIDDAPHNLERFTNSSNRHAICFRQPWNAEWTGKYVNGFDDLFTEIEKISMEKNIA